MGRGPPGGRGFTREAGAASPHSPLHSARSGRGAWKGGRQRGGAEGGSGVPAAARQVGKPEGPHLRNPPPAAAAAASLRPGDLGARPACPAHTDASQRRRAPRRNAAEQGERSGAATRLGVGDEPRPRRGPPRSQLFALPGPGERLWGLGARGGGGARGRW